MWNTLCLDIGFENKNRSFIQISFNSVCLDDEAENVFEIQKKESN